MATNLYNSISEKWAATAALQELLPAELIFTGRAEDASATEKVNPPYVVLIDETEDREGASSKARWYMCQITIEVRVDGFANARQIQKLYRLALEADGWKPTLDDGVCVEWHRLTGGRLVENGKVAVASDTYQFIKQISRS